MPGKQGWIAEGRPQPGERLRFDAALPAARDFIKRGKLTVSFLRSYEGQGAARLWLGADEEAAVTFNGIRAPRGCKTTKIHVDVIARCACSMQLAACLG